ncbi:galactosyltransferase-related protein [uncultured Tateyamaria sp.]|uniref:galactosyltransferase-related protein n=1 Tax=uncultured Tateyamaria sp. TaxID=455651 RepID=UPI00344FDB8D
MKVGCYDNWFQSWGGEDDDLAYRLQQNGVSFRLSRSAGSIHLPHSKDEETNEASGIRNLEYIYRKFGDPIIHERIIKGWELVNMPKAGE